MTKIKNEIDALLYALQHLDNMSRALVLRGSTDVLSMLRALPDQEMADLLAAILDASEKLPVLHESLSDLRAIAVKMEYAV
jgi:hypothetical protein